jgi:[ribosomal protein S5]-alanine N-acetyltransferase
MAARLLSAGELPYCGVMSQKPAPVSEKQPLVILTTPRLVLRAAAEEEIIGFAGLSPCDALGARDFEIGFVLARRVWGKGIATEIGEAQLAFGFEQLKCGRLLGLVDPRNAPSIHALEKLGMRLQETIADPRRGSRSVYVIEAAEWQQRRAE